PTDGIVYPAFSQIRLLCFNIIFGWQEPQIWHLIFVTLSEIGHLSDRQIGRHMRHGHPEL
ncbi:MAG: hypothetical protein V3V39_04975, partial [Desulfobacterales bacterium]